MAEPRARVLEFAVALDRDGRRHSGGHDRSRCPGTGRPSTSSSPALLECSLTSLRYHAGRVGVAVEASGGAGRGRSPAARRTTASHSSTIDARLDVRFDPAPADQVPGCSPKAERDCFVGASLTATPRYAWKVA